MKRLFDAIPEEVTSGIVSYETMKEIKRIAEEDGITRDDVVKAWGEELHPSETKDMNYEEYRLKQSKYSAITATFDYYAKTCVLCNEKYTEYGNNAEPLAEGQCCDKCNDKVVEARLAQLFG